MEAVGKNGTIFAHFAKGVEIKILNKLRFTSSKKIISFISTINLANLKKLTKNKNITRAIKQKASSKSNVWAFAYNATHFAGLQVFFQAFLNQNTIVRLFGVSRTNCFKLINDFKITNISATPTFYRLLLPPDIICHSLQNLTSGGEKFDSTTLQKLNHIIHL